MEAPPSRWETVKSLFELVQELAPEKASQFLAANCGDSEICQEVERLLREYRKDKSFLSTPAIGTLCTAEQENRTEFAPGEILAGRYRIIEFIAAGGMGVVYKAEDLDLRRYVALKFVSLEAVDSQAQARLRREAQAASALNHPNICTIYEIGNHGGRPFMAMEFLEGATLKQRLSNGPLPVDDLLSLGSEIADALAAAHAAGVFHRDIKPANIFITVRGHAKILDFGIAAGTRVTNIPDSAGAGSASGSGTTPGVIAGTANYMSPEQIRGEVLDRRTDLFSLGVTLYEMATARKPFEGETPYDVCQQIMTATPTPPLQVRPEIPNEVEKIIQTCLEKKRELRYENAAEVATALEELKRERASGLEVATLKARNRWFAAGLLSVLLLVLGGTSWLYLHRTPRLTEKDSIVLADFANTTGDPVFNDALKAGLLADLGQSPFLNILSEDDIAKQLRFMGLPADSPLTSQVAREVCQRAGSRTMLAGAIASLGSHYAITLSASDCETGGVVAVEQAEASRREQVLSRLHDAARRLRGRLGESLASVEKHDTPLEQATTSSLEALQAFSQAQKVFRSQGEAGAIPLFQRALTLDPNFAVALSDLGTLYCNLGQVDLCTKYATRAYALRDRVSERERHVIEASYFMNVTGELEKAAQVYEEWKQLYPRTLYPYVQLENVAASLGHLEVGLDNGLAAYGLHKNAAVVYRNLSLDYMVLNRFDEAKAILDEARDKKLDRSLLQNYYRLAFLRSDPKEMERSVSATSGDPEDESAMLSGQADTEAYYGRLLKARELTHRAVAIAVAAGSKDSAANWEATAALREAEFGNVNEASGRAQAALSLSSAEPVKIAAALAFARAGHTSRAAAIAGTLARQFPKGTLVNNYWLPTIRAAIALNRRDPARALKELEIAAPYELGGDTPPFSSGATLYPVYLRGEAYSSERNFAKAQAEFQKVIDRYGLVWNFPTGILSRLQLARAYAGSGNVAGARSAYQKYFELWSHAEESSPLLQRARREYARLSK
jgi:eukaryotic-like serine/threonine-protein kinase